MCTTCRRSCCSSSPAVFRLYTPTARAPGQDSVRLGSGLGLVLGLVLRFCAYSYGGVYNRNTAGGELQQERRQYVGLTTYA